MSESADFDSILEKLSGTGGAGAPAATDPMMQMMMLQMQQDRADRRASRDTMLQMIGTLAPVLLPMLFKKEADPVMMTLLQGMMTKNNDNTQTQVMLDMMRNNASVGMEQLKAAMLSIIETKDTLHKKALDEALESGSAPESGPAAILRELRLGLGALAGSALLPTTASAPALPAPTTSAPAGNNPAQKPRHPVAVVLYQMRAVQTGEIKKEQQPAAIAAMVTVALQDEGLINVLGSGDIQQVVEYCMPHIKADAKLISWVSTDGVAVWVDHFVQRRFIPLVDAALDDGEGDDETEEDSGAEPETLTAEDAKHVGP